MALTDNLVAYWKFDESSGDATDIVGGHTATAVGSTTYAAGKINNAALFDGNGDYFTTVDSTDFSPGTGAFTIGFWFYQDAVSTYGCPVCMRKADTATVNDFSFLTDWGGDRRMAIYTNGFHGGVDGEWLSAQNVLPLDTWVYLTIVGNGAADGARQIKAYINGVQYVYGDVNYNFNKNVLVIGKDYVGSSATRSVNGKIDEFGFWKGKALTTNEMADLYYGGAGIQYPFNMSTITGVSTITGASSITF